MRARGFLGRSQVRRTRPDPSVLILVENQPYLTDTRVKAEAAALKEAGWTVHVIGPDGGRGGQEARRPAGSSAEHAGIHVHSYPIRFADRGLFGYAREYLGSLSRMARLSWGIHRRSGFSVIHLCNPPDMLFVLAVLYRMLGVRVVFDHHDLFPEMILSRHKGPSGRAFSRVARLMEFLTFRTADAVVTTNLSYRDVALRRGRVAAEDIFVVRNGPRLDEIAPVPPDPALKRGYPFMGCYAGIMGPEDGVLELMDVIRHIVIDLRRTDILFCLLGDGAVRAEAARRARAWKIQDHVDMPGMIIDRALFRRYLSSADIMLSPEISNPHNDKSTFIKIAEYMAIGKPIVAYDLTETRFTAGEASAYVPSGDAGAFARTLVGLIDDPERRAVMGRTGLERVKTRFQWDCQKGSLLEAYRHALAKRP
jgi:glycosyltransferase involved in cell wall biosynthesis